MRAQERIELNLPAEALLALEGVKSGRMSLSDKVALAVAIDLFLRGEISFAKAAELAEVSRQDFNRLLSDRGIPAVEYTEESLVEDLKTLDFLRTGS